MGPANLRPVDHDVSINECATVHGASMWQQQGYISVFDTPAIEDSFTFATPAAATRAYHALAAGMAHCQDVSRTLQTTNQQPADALVQRTATSSNGVAFRRRWTAVAGMTAPGPQTNHVYLVHNGTTLTALQFTGTATVPGSPQRYDTADDSATLIDLSH
ncbi:hypothetical protein ACLMNJ_28415 [Streptomyces seoulensis]